jgi:predicted DNA-binding transcriptional regulator AlpA
MTVIAKLKTKQGLIDAKEVARLLNMNKEVLYRRVKAGLVPHFRILGKVKFDPVVLAEWLEERQVHP